MSQETSEIPDRFPKVRSPYKRQDNSNGQYVVDPDGRFQGVEPGFEWVFDRASEVEAIEKLDGTNCAVYFDETEDDPVRNAATRMGDKSMQEVMAFGRRDHQMIFRAIQNTVSRGYHERVVDEHGPGWFFGETVGPDFQENPHGLDENLFVPFEWLREKCQYKSYGRYDTDYESLRDWFRGGRDPTLVERTLGRVWDDYAYTPGGLFSLFATKMDGSLDYEDAMPSNGTFVEGLILIHPDYDGPIEGDSMARFGSEHDTLPIAKLRRDMYQSHADGTWPMTEHGHH